MEASEFLRHWASRKTKAEAAAHEILAGHVEAKSRVVDLTSVVKKLNGLPQPTIDYYDESLKCLRYELYRSAVVLSWSGFFYSFSYKLFSDYEEKIKEKYISWKFNDASELREAAPESQILIAAKAVRLISNSDFRKFDGQLSIRNQCAHPTDYKPSYNEALGFVDSMIVQAKRFL